MKDGPLSVWLIAGEESGDQLGASLMRGLTEATGGAVRYAGVGGDRMVAHGMEVLFPLADIAVNGLSDIIRHLPGLIARINRAAEAVIAARPDVLVIIDAPDFTHRVAARVRAAAPEIPIVNYVSPTVWAWRPGRARKMAAYIDHVLALFPFEPAVHARLGGPPCTYVGHPLLEKLPVLRPGPGERSAFGAAPPVLLMLPGSRRGEIRRHMQPFGAALAEVTRQLGPVEAILPAVSHLRPAIEAALADWPVKPTVVVGEAEKFAAFRRAHGAIAASGTVTLELALAGVPSIVAYRLDTPYRIVKWINGVIPIITASTMVLANIVLGENALPELLDDQVTPEALAGAVGPFLSDTPVRRALLEKLDRIDRVMALPDGRTPSAAAAEVVLRVIAEGAGAPRLPAR
ncbi:lipid-A-disaccharide synthase [Segnochrobactraceae bacterium EtOH-i3]